MVHSYRHNIYTGLMFAKSIEEWICCIKCFDPYEISLLIFKSFFNCFWILYNESNVTKYCRLNDFVLNSLSKTKNFLHGILHCTNKFLADRIKWGKFNMSNCFVVAWLISKMRIILFFPDDMSIKKSKIPWKNDLN